MRSRPTASGPVFGPVLWKASPLAAAAIGPALALALPAHAQTPPPTPPPTRSEVLRFRPPEPVEIPEAGPTCKVAPVALSELPAAGAPLEAVTLEMSFADGVQRPSDEWSALIGRPVDATVMQRVADRVACLYGEAGYVLARAEARETAPGRWTVRVAEGRVARLVVEGGDDKARDFVRKAFGAVQPGRPLRQADLRRGQTLARAYGFWGLRPVARPTPDDPEASEIVITVTPSRAAVFLSAQNASPETVGEWSAGASVIVHGLTPLNEKTVVGLFHGLTSDRQRGAQISSDALLTEGGLGLRGDLAWFEQKPDEVPPNQDTIGVTKLARAELNHPIVALPNALTTWRVGLEAVNQDTELLNGVPTLRDRLRVAYAGARIEGQSGDVTGEANLTVRKGLDAFGASRPGDPLLSRPEADPQAATVRFDARASRPLAKGQVSVRARGQWADKPLTAFEEFTWGGLDGGRGVNPGALFGDRGLSAGVEFAGAPFATSGKFKLSPIAFVEGARAWNEDQAFGPKEQSAITGGGGLRLTWNDRVHLDTTYATPLGPVSGVPDALAGPRLHVALSAGFEVDW